MMYLHHIAYVVGLTRSNRFVGGVLGFGARYHRLTVAPLVSTVFLSHFLSTGQWQGALAVFLGVAANLSYALIVSLWSKALTPKPGPVAAKVVFDLLFATLFVYLEWHLIRPQTSALSILFLVPLLLAGYYLTIKRLLGVYFVMAVVFLTMPTIALGRLPMWPSEYVIAFVVLISSLVLHIAGAYTESHLRKLDGAQRAIEREFELYWSGRVKRAEFFAYLVSALQSLFSSDYVAIVQQPLNANELVVTGVAGSEDLGLLRLPTGSDRPHFTILRVLRTGEVLKGSVGGKDASYDPVAYRQPGHFAGFPLPNIGVAGHSVAVELGRGRDFPFAPFEVTTMENISRNSLFVDKWRHETLLAKFLNDMSGKELSQIREAELLQRFLDLVQITTNIEYCSYWQYDFETDRLAPRVYLGLNDEFMKEVSTLGTESETYRLLIQRQVPLSIPDIWNHPKLAHLNLIQKYYGRQINSLLIVPLFIGDQRVGTLHFWAKDAEDLDEIAHLMNQLCGQIAGLIVNLRAQRPEVKHAIDEYTQYFLQNHIVKKKQDISVSLERVDTGGGLPQKVKVTISDSFELYNVSDQLEEADVRTAVLNFQSHSRGTDESTLVRLIGASIGDMGETASNMTLEDLGVGPFPRLSATARVASRKSVPVRYELEYVMPVPDGVAILTEKLSISPKYNVKWSKGLECSCFTLSHVKCGKQTSGERSWTVEFKERSTVLPYQGVYIGWTASEDKPAPSA
jgi:hypothetical protein